MSSDTESTVCDPRLEVAPEPQVPKGPGQIRRVPQLFSCSQQQHGQSTPVVPPQVQQTSGVARRRWDGVRPDLGLMRLYS